MILLDANLLIYAHDDLSPFQESAKGWLEEVLSGPERVGISWITLLAFLRITTNPRIVQNPFSPMEALGLIQKWLSVPHVELIQPGDRHVDILARMLFSSGARGPLVMDAHLAALAIEHQATLCTTDRDFGQFPGLRLHYPLAPVR